MMDRYLARQGTEPYRIAPKPRLVRRAPFLHPQNTSEIQQMLKYVNEILVATLAFTKHF